MVGFIKLFRLNIFLGILLTQFIFFSLLHYVPNFSRDVLCLPKAFYLWPYFSMGVLLKRFNLEATIVRAYVWPLSMIIVLIWSVFELPLSGWVIPFFIIVLLFVFAVKFQNRFNTPLFFRKGIVLIGMNTLQIYSLHYFFLKLLSFPQIGDMVIAQGLRWLEFIVSPLMGLLIALLCVFTSRIFYRLHLGFIFGR